MAVSAERQEEFTQRLLEAERTQRLMLEQLAQVKAQVATMQRIVAAAVTRRQDGRIPID